MRGPSTWTEVLGSLTAGAQDSAPIHANSQILHDDIANDSYKYV